MCEEEEIENIIAKKCSFADKVSRSFYTDIIISTFDDCVI